MLPSTPALTGDGDLITGIPACELRKGLYIGGLAVLNSAAELGISHVLSVINDMPELSTRVWKLSMKHLLIDMPDMAEANLLPHFQQAVSFISSAVGSNGKVLVHCQAGVSRSASVVLAYLMATERISMESALASVRHVYPYASPNEGSGVKVGGSKVKTGDPFGWSPCNGCKSYPMGQPKGNYTAQGKCKARLGSYNWAGSQSESGAWVTPAFQLHHSKVDAMSAQKAAPMNIRQPLVGPATTRSTSTSQPTAAQATFDLRSQTDSVQQQMSPENGEANRLKDDSVVPVDAARTVSEAAHSAALIASEIDRPAVVPRNDSKHRDLNASVVR
ncbi:TPA: hypothetical protein ACH3X3_006841 [Trebouxia sp. C0006]